MQILFQVYKEGKFIDNNIKATQDCGKNRPTCRLRFRSEPRFRHGYAVTYGDFCPVHHLGDPSELFLLFPSDFHPHRESLYVFQLSI